MMFIILASFPIILLMIGVMASAMLPPAGFYEY